MVATRELVVVAVYYRIKGRDSRNASIVSYPDRQIGVANKELSLVQQHGERRRD